jgi:dTDP-glucose 4,6-dehydratase
VLDKLTYAGNLDNLRDVAGDPRYSFVKGDICDPEVVDQVAAGADAIVNFAAETHVDRSISGPEDFIRTDVIGTHVLLEAVRARGVGRFVQISTDEVYGDIERAPRSRPTCCARRAPTRPARPAASCRCWPTGAPTARRSSSRAAPTTTGRGSTPRRSCRCSSPTPSTASRCRSTATAATCATGSTSTTTAAALDLVLRAGADGEIYNVGGGNEVENLDLTRGILAELGLSEELVRYVADRPGHDRRYALDCAKVRALGWEPRVTFAEGLARTVAWYARAPRVVGEDQVGRVAALLRAPVSGGAVARLDCDRPGAGARREPPGQTDGAVGRRARESLPDAPGRAVVAQAQLDDAGVGVGDSREHVTWCVVTTAGSETQPTGGVRS